jgi:transcriptional regulator with XRE-family HTH domain
MLQRDEERQHALNLSAREVAKRAGKPAVIKNLRRGVLDGDRSGISTATLAALAAALEVRQERLLTGEGDPGVPTTDPIYPAPRVSAGLEVARSSVPPPTVLGTDDLEEVGVGHEMGLGDNVRALRTARGWSLRKLGAQLDVSAQTIHGWESGRHGPETDRLHALVVPVRCDG